MTISIRAVAFLALAPLAPAADILVAPQGGGDSTTIQGAIDLAADGDLIVVLPGNYPENLVLDDLSVWIVAQQPGTAHVAGSLSVLNLTRRDHCVVSGLTFKGVPNPALSRQDPALFIQGSQGVFHAHQCLFEGAQASTQNLGVGGPGALLIGARRFIATQTDFIAGNGADQSSVCTGSEGGPGLRAIDSRVTIWGGAIEGGAGTSCGRSLPFTSGDGGTGLLATGSSVFLSSVAATGGAGGEDLDFIPSIGGDGGDAIDADAGTFLLLQAPTLTAGAAGGSLLGTAGTPGSNLSGNGVLRMLGGTPQIHELPILLPVGAATALVVRGNAGQAAAVFGQVGQPPFIFDLVGRPGQPTAAGSLPVGLAPIALGVIPASGELNGSLTFPPLPAGSTSLPLTVRINVGRNQALSLLGSPLPVVAIDCATFGQDCDADGSANICELLAGTAQDLDQNGVPDGCQPDCNGNGTPDFIDLGAGTSTDFNGNGVPDECDTPGTVHVDPAAAPGGDGSPQSPFKNLREAVHATISGGEIVLADGAYTSADDRDIELLSRAITIRSSGGPGACLIEMQGNGRAFSSNDAIAGQGLVVSGIRFENGDVSGRTGVTGADEGGALFVRGSKVTVVNCVFDSNLSDAGGAVSLRSSIARLESCVFDSNHQAASSGGGGAVYLLGGDLEIENCTFEGNDASFAGGALRLRPDTGDRVAVSRCTFYGNESGMRAGAIAVAPLNSLGADIVYLSQCVLAHNQAPVGGAVGGSGQSRTFMALCTLTGNASTNRAGAVAAQLGMDLIAVNNIIWGNSAPVGPQISIIGMNSSVSISSSNLEGDLAAIEVLGGGSFTAGAGLIDAPPLFVNRNGPDGDPLTFADNDYRLAAGSPSIDAGDAAFISPDVTDMDGDLDRFEPSPFDLDGNPRRRDDPGAPNTGLGGIPHVDHGAFER